MRKIDDFEGRSPYPRESGEVVPRWYRWYMRAVVPASGLLVFIGYFGTNHLTHSLIFDYHISILFGPVLILLVLFLAHIGIAGYAFGKRISRGFLPNFGHFIMLCWIFLCFATLFQLLIPGPG
jgi:hypothetical protein